MINNGFEVPDGYGAAIERADINEEKASHLYELLDNGKYGRPMCEDGWNNRIYGYTIFKNRISKKGICTVCMERALKGLEGVDYKLKAFDRLTQKDQELIVHAMIMASMELSSNENDLEYIKDKTVERAIERDMFESKRLIYLIRVLCGEEEYKI